MITSQRIAILGFGNEAVSAANYFANSNKILIYDDKNKEEIDESLFKKLKADVDFYFKKDIDVKVDIIIRSPGVRPDHLQIIKLVRKGAIITSPTQIFFEKSPAKIIGVTGTKGKGTTSTLIYKMLKTKTKNVFLAGNIGTPMLEILPKVKKDSLVVLELSSFQLMDLTISPHVAVILMITKEHLDWHENLNEYHVAKESIVSYQSKSDYAIINADFEKSRQFSKKTKAQIYFFSTQHKTNGVYIEGDKLISKMGSPELICKTGGILLPGRHNLQNAAAATSVAKIFGIKKSKIVQVLSTFKGLDNRLQLVRKVNGVRYYNDSFSTTPETTIAAIESYTEPKVLILGGSSKNSDFTMLAKKISQEKTIKALILVGNQAKTIENAITKEGGFKGNIIRKAKNMGQIVENASKIATYGDIVILSPACASFDMFKNYQDRGQKFIDEVNRLVS